MTFLRRDALRWACGRRTYDTRANTFKGPYRGPPRRVVIPSRDARADRKTYTAPPIRIIEFAKVEIVTRKEKKGLAAGAVIAADVFGVWNNVWETRQPNRFFSLTRVMPAI